MLIWVLVFLAVLILVVLLVRTALRFSARMALQAGPATEFTTRLNVQLMKSGQSLEATEDRILGLPHAALSPSEREYFRVHVNPKRGSYRTLLKRAFVEEGSPYDVWAAALRRPYEPLIDTIVKEALREIRAGILD